MALVHGIFLEAGPTVTTMRSWTLQVRVTLPDAGREHVLNDSVDVIEQYLQGDAGPDDLDLASGSYLFPLSMWVPEASHQWDLVMKSPLHSMTFFKNHLTEMQCCVTFLRSDGQRQILQFELERVTDVKTAKVLEHPPCSICNLRWGTLSRASGWLQAKERVLGLCFHKDLFPTAREGNENARVHGIVHGGTFFKRNKAVRTVTKYVETERSWGQ